jgi:hypothetical protein
VHTMQIVDPFNETALEVFARISALRDELDGPPVGPPCSPHCPVVTIDCWTGSVAHLQVSSCPLGADH